MRAGKPRTLALNVAAGACGKWSIDAGRHSRERIPPAEYLRMSYYEKWLTGLVMLLEETGLVSRAEARKATIRHLAQRWRSRRSPFDQVAPTLPADGRSNALNRPAALCGRSAGACTKDQPDRPHSLAALCARQCRVLWTGSMAASLS